MCLFGWLALLGCAHYQPAPIAPAQSAAALEERSLDAGGLKVFVERNSPQPLPEWPLRQWDFEKLTLAALYYHPSLDVARAQWNVARAGELAAGARANPTVGLGPAYNINPASGVTPWLALIDFDIPVETAGKRGHRLAQAKHLTQAARLNLAAAAWQVRANLRQAVMAFAAAGQRAELLHAQISVQQQVVQQMEQKLAAGAAAVPDLAPHRIALLKTSAEAAEAVRVRTEARARIAGAVGVPSRALEGVEIIGAMPDPQAAAAQLSTAEARRRALHSRADILAALAEYEATQSALQLEIARQYPDIHLGPGYEYDQGGHKFGLQLSAELPLLNRNQGPIAQASARREEAAARFLQLQARVLAEIDQALAAWQAAERQTSAVDVLIAAQRQQQAHLQAQFEAGIAEALEVLLARVEIAAGALALHDARLRQQQALAELEDAIQLPLEVDLSRPGGSRR